VWPSFRCRSGRTPRRGASDGPREAQDMVEQFPPESADKALGEGVHVRGPDRVRRPWCRRLRTGSRTEHLGWRRDRRRALRAGYPTLCCAPAAHTSDRRRPGDCSMNDSPSLQIEKEQDEDRRKSSRTSARSHKPSNVVAEESTPALAFAGDPLLHVPLHGALRDRIPSLSSSPRAARRPSLGFAPSSRGSASGSVSAMDRSPELGEIEFLRTDAGYTFSLPRSLVGKLEHTWRDAGHRQGKGNPYCVARARSCAASVSPFPGPWLGHGTPNGPAERRSAAHRCAVGVVKLVGDVRGRRVADRERRQPQLSSIMRRTDV